jgi:hypothetical protein
MSKTILFVCNNRELTVEYMKRLQKWFPFSIIEGNKRIFDLEWNNDYLVLLDSKEVDKTPLNKLVSKLREERCSVVFMQTVDENTALYSIVSNFYEKAVLFVMDNGFKGVESLSDHLLELMLD